MQIRLKQTSLPHHPPVQLWWADGDGRCVIPSRTIEDTGAFDGWWVGGVSWRFLVVVDVVNARMDRMWWVHEG